MPPRPKPKMTKAQREKIAPARMRSPEPDLHDDVDDDDDLPAPSTAQMDHPDEDSSAELSAILAELGGASDASISVNKVTLQGEERLGKFMPREFDVDSLRERYGGGVYWIYFHLGGRLHTKRRVIFAKTLDEQRGNEPAAAARSSPADTLTQALDRMAALQREQFSQMLTLVQRPQGPGLAEIITLAEKMASMGASRGSGGDAVDTLLKGFDLARKFGAGGEEISIGGALAELVRALREGPAPLPAAGANGSGGGDHMQAIVQRALAQQLPVLLRGAQSESDVGVYAQLIFDQVPELYLRPMVEYLKKPDWFDLLARADGRVVPHQPWFEALRNEIVRETSPELPPAS